MASPGLSSLMQRGFEMGQEHIHNAKHDPENTYQLPTFVAVLLGCNVLFLTVLSHAVEYTYGRMIPTLVMVESPEAIMFEPILSDDPDALIAKTAEPVLMARPKYITASFRATIKHLQSKGGFRARFRGFSMYMVYRLAIQFSTVLLHFILPSIFASVTAVVLCAQLSLAWTHIVISDPNPKPWFKRIPSYKTWKKVAIPTAMLAIAEQVACIIPAYFVIALVAGSQHSYDSNGDIWILCVKIASIVISAIVLIYVAVIPASIILTRVQASLLPEECETVVPFDPSFGCEASNGDTGSIGVVDAWKSFSWNAHTRLVKAYAKALAMQVAVGLLALVLFSTQIALFVGKDFKKLVPPSLLGEHAVVNSTEL